MSIVVAFGLDGCSVSRALSIRWAEALEVWRNPRRSVLGWSGVFGTCQNLYVIIFHKKPVTAGGKLPWEAFGLVRGRTCPPYHFPGNLAPEPRYSLEVNIMTQENKLLLATLLKRCTSRMVAEVPLLSNTTNSKG
jgi:hypothetical protein